MGRDKLDELYEDMSFYDEYIEYIESFEQAEIRKNLEKITREIVKTRLEQAVFAIVLQSVDDPDVIDAYITSFKIFPVGNTNNIYFSPSSPAIGIIEAGAKPFNMKEKILGSGNVKISKKGFPYKTIPLSREMPGKNAKLDTLRTLQKRAVPFSAQQTVLTSKEIEVQAKLNSVLQEAKFSFLKEARDAEGRTIQKSITRSDEVGTLIREQTFETTGRKTKVVKTKYVIFRTMSAKPGTSEWMHPGFSGKEIYSKVLDWQNENEKAIFESTLENLLERAFSAVPE